jgi:hypothetical protein
MEWKHNELAEDLADCKETKFLDVPLGSVQLDDNTQRADVVEIKPSYKRFCVNIYEVKISRADFLSDIRSGKWKGYLSHCHRFYFAAPKGMLTKEDIPEEAGLIVRDDNGWYSLIAPQAREVIIPERTMMSLLFMKERERFRERQRDKKNDSYNRYHHTQREEFYKKLGSELGEALRNYDEYKSAVTAIENLQDRIRNAIAEGLGVKYEPGSWDYPEFDLTAVVRELKKKLGNV